MPRAHGRRGVIGLGLLAPATLLVVGIFVVPLVLMALRSLHVYDSFSGQAGDDYTLANYREFFTSSRFLGVFWRTMKLAFIATVISLVVGYPVAYYIRHQSGRRQMYLMLAVVSPLLVFVVVRTFGWTLILGNRGLVNSLLSALGLIDDPLGLMLTEGAITVGLVHVYIPYMILAIYTSLQNVDPRVVLAARSLGGSAFRAFLGVTLPLSVPGIASGSLLVFTLSASSFSTPAILGGQRAQVMSYVVYKEIYALQDWEFGSTVSMILLLSIGVVALLYLRLIENRRYRAVFG